MYKSYLSEYLIKLEVEQTEEINLKEDIVKSSIIIKSIPSFTSKLVELDILDKSLDEKLFASGEISLIMILFSGLVEDSGLNIVSIQPDSDGNVLKNNIWSKQINISLQGNAKSLSYFISELVTGQKIMQVSEMKVARVNDDLLDIHMVISIFYLRK
ncbi:MAG: type 4a pilus biogenesis protein PilO [Burkholderiales bacterium]|nr:type 4a pilus biogenesis protein PilO [Burkholderiales bacterium]